MIYWDNNATTPLATEVWDAMQPYLKEQFFNPSAAYTSAKRVRQAIERAREQVAALVGAYPDEIIFTSGGTEASNTALSQFKHTLTLPTEHPATLRTVKGEAATVLSNGLADLLVWKNLVPEYDSVSFAWANHETGVIQPIRSLSGSAADVGARVHVDLVQAAGKVAINLHDYPIDFASLSAHKLHGPKGVGALYVRRGTAFSAAITGGAQEDYRRAGTENVPGIIGSGRVARAFRYSFAARRTRGSTEWWHRPAFASCSQHAHSRYYCGIIVPSIGAYGAYLLHRFCLYQRRTKPKSCIIGHGLARFSYT